MTWQVRVLKLGPVDVPVPEVLFMTGLDQWCVLDFYMVAATDGDKTAMHDPKVMERYPGGIIKGPGRRGEA